MASASSSGTEEEQEADVHPPCLESPTEHVPITSRLNSCISRTREERGRPRNAEVPTHKAQIRKGNFQLKFQVANIVEKIQLLGLEGTESLCVRRKEALTWQDGRESPGVTSDPSCSHQPGPAGPREEAARECKEEIQSCLEDLKKQREELLGLKRAGRRRSLEYLKQMDAERRKIASGFQRLHQFLEEQEQVLLARLGDLERQIARRHKENTTKLAGEISLLNVLITDTERMCQQPATELLQDVRITWSRCNKLHSQKPTEAFLELERKLSAFSHHTVALRETLRKCQDTLARELDKDWEKSPGTDGKTNVTLDPDTANPWLLLSVDQKCGSWVATRQDLPVRHQRFSSSHCVLGCQGFTSGRHFWEVEPGLAGAWAVGVSRASVGRKGWVNFCPEEGIWAVGLSGAQYRAFTSPVAPLSLNHVPKRIQILVDYERGLVAFSSVDNKDPIFTFPEASFSGEKIFPFFWVGRGSRLRLCP